VLQTNIFLQYGHADAARDLLGVPDPDELEIGSTDHLGAYGLMLLQLGRPDEARSLFEPAYRAAEFDGVAMNMGSRLALTYAALRRPDDALAVINALQERAGGTYHDRLLVLWAEAAARFQTSGDPRAAVDAAHAIATSTDSPLEQAIAAHVRALVFEAMQSPDASEVRADANRQLDALDISGAGWTTVMHAAL
jgi:tetratricopeptide (TPR) repeat protein